MKLQINASGSWRNVIEFDAKDSDQVVPAAVVLARAAKPPHVNGKRASWCIVHDNDQREWLGTLTDALAHKDEP